MPVDTFEPLAPKVILAIGAHADDIDFAAAGSLVKWAQSGTEIHYLVITNGCKGTANPDISTESLISMRQQEQRDAAQVVGTENVHFFDYEDSTLEVTRELKLKLVQLIRETRPDTVITLDPTMVYIAELGFINHPDHRAAGQATLDAIFPLARDHLSFPELHDSGLKPHKVAHVLLINHEKQNYYVDVSNEFEAKTSALCKHVSQVNDTMLTAMTDYAQRMGAEASCAYAEGFMRIDIPA